MRRGKHNRQRGTAMVEFAIVAPLLIFLILAVAEFGHALNQYNTLTKAVRNGARYLAGEALYGNLNVVYLPAELIQATQQRVVQGTALPGLTTGQVGVTRVDDQHVGVSVTYPYTPLLGAGARLPTFGLGGGDIPLGFTFRASVVMRAL